MICATCEKPMEAPEAGGFMNQYADRITYSVKRDVSGALEVHLHSACKSVLKKDGPMVVELAIAQPGSSASLHIRGQQ